MEYSVNLSKDKKYIILKVSGKIDAENIIKPILESHALGLELDIHNYLMDATEAKNVESTIGNYSFAYNDMKHAEGIDFSAKVAALVDPDDHTHDFVETVNQNAGYNFALFRDRKKAIKFLMS